MKRGRNGLCCKEISTRTCKQASQMRAGRFPGRARITLPHSAQLDTALAMQDLQTLMYS